MPAATMFAVFEDFNEFKEKPVEPPAEDISVPSTEQTAETWMDGYLTGYQLGRTASNDQPLSAKLLTSMHDLGADVSRVADAASVAIADLLMNTVIAISTDDWSRRLPDRVRLIADRVRPAVTARTEFLVQDDLGTTRRFEDIAELSRALETGSVSNDVVIQWQGGEALISQTALLKELREVIVPLSAGWIAAENPQDQT